MRLATRYRWQIVLGRALKKIARKSKKAAPRFELGIKDLQSSALPLGHAAEKEFLSSIKDRISQDNKFLLFLCNGHGEDLIARRIMEAIHNIAPDISLEVLPLVGDGRIFDAGIEEGWITRIGVTKTLPSGGFVNQSFRVLIEDIFSGLFSLLFKQVLSVRKAVRNKRFIVAVGDLFPLALAWSSGAKYVFVGTPKSDYTWTSSPQKSFFLSDYFHRLKGSEWDLWEIALMKSDRCKFVAVRDSLTARGLSLHNVAAFSPGNPMMDAFPKTPCPVEFDSYRKLLLLCGTRMPEAKKNFGSLLQAVELINSKSSLMIFVALGQAPSLFEVEAWLINCGYQRTELLSEDKVSCSSWKKKSITLLVGVNKFNLWANWVEIGLANAGTATEQLVGLGIPCVSLPGNGPQFTHGFATRQSRLLGGAVSPCATKEIFAEKVTSLLSNQFLSKTLGAIGSKRMGPEGGSEALAKFILQSMLFK